MHKRAPKRGNGKEAELEPLQARRWFGIMDDIASRRIRHEQAMRMQPAEVKIRVASAAQRGGLNEMIDVGVGPLRLAPKEVQKDREGRAPDDGEHLHEPVGREIRVDLPLKGVRYPDASHDLHDDRIDAPEVLDVVDDESLAHQTVEPVNDVPI